MSDDRERRVLSVFRDVLARPAGQRSPFLDATCGADDELRTRVLALLRRDEADGADAQEAAGAPAAAPAAPAAAAAARDPRPEGVLIRALQPDTVLGDFRLVKLVGEGGIGQVWEAEQISLRRRVAIKLLKPGLAHGADALRRFRLEAETAGGLRHPGIVTVYAIGEAEGCPFLAQELIEGGIDMRQWVERQRDGARRADHERFVAQLMAQVADAVQAAHAAGVVHRDIKPHNIMLRADGRPVVLDFGLAALTRAEDVSETRGLIGSVPYMAPEQIRSEEVGHDPRTDVYQLGATLYELLTLRMAFPERDFTRLFEQIPRGDFPRPRSLDARIPWELEAICLKAMALSPEQRYASARAFGEDLQRFLGGHEAPLAARGGRALGALRRVPYLVRRHKLATVGAVAIVAGLLAGVGLRNGPVRKTTFEPVRWTSASGRLDLPSLLAGKGRKISWDSSDEVRPGDLLGVDVVRKTKGVIYTLSVFGQRSPPTWILPTEPVLLGADGVAGNAPASGAPAAERRWGREVPAGTVSVAASSVDKADPSVPCEGLLVLACDEPQPVLERWMDLMSEAAREQSTTGGAQQPAVAYANAGRLLERAHEPTRGGSPKLDAAQARVLAGLTADAVLGPDEPELPDFDKLLVMFRVVE